MTETLDSERRLTRFREAIAAHIACSIRIDVYDYDVTRAVEVAIVTGDELEDSACGIPREHRAELVEARRVMDASLRRLNQRSLQAGRIAMIEEQCAWSRAVLARVPELMLGV